MGSIKNKILDFSSVGLTDMIGAGTVAIFWFYIASLVGDKTYGEITYFLTIAGIGSVVSMLGASSALTVYAAKGERILQTFAVIVFPISAIAGITTFFMFYNVGASIHVFTYVIFLLITSEYVGRKLFKKYMTIL